MICSWYEERKEEDGGGQRDLYTMINRVLGKRKDRFGHDDVKLGTGGRDEQQKSRLSAWSDVAGEQARATCGAGAWLWLWQRGTGCGADRRQHCNVMGDDDNKVKIHYW